MNPNKAPWEKGDFTRIAASMRESGQALVSALGVKSGLKVFGSWMRRRHHSRAGSETWRGYDQYRRCRGLVPLLNGQTNLF